jgi:hypothetical protein
MSARHLAVHDEHGQVVAERRAEHDAAADLHHVAGAGDRRHREERQADGQEDARRAVHLVGVAVRVPGLHHREAELDALLLVVRVRQGGEARGDTLDGLVPLLVAQARGTTARHVAQAIRRGSLRGHERPQRERDPADRAEDQHDDADQQIRGGEHQTSTCETVYIRNPPMQ